MEATEERLPEDRGFRTVLMTATLTDESFETIAAF